ncbi:MAG: hypothetical protein QM783_04150 [Phycisphaerales bacterium]
MQTTACRPARAHQKAAPTAPAATSVKLCRENVRTAQIAARNAAAATSATSPMLRQRRADELKGAEGARVGSSLATSVHPPNQTRTQITGTAI